MAVNHGQSKKSANWVGAGILWFALGTFGSASVGVAQAQQQAPMPMEPMEPMESSEPEPPKVEPPKVEPPKVEPPKAEPPSAPSPGTTDRPSTGLIINLEEDAQDPAPAVQPEPVRQPAPVQTPAPPVAAPTPPATAPAPPIPTPAPPVVAPPAPTPPVAQPPAPTPQPPKSTPRAKVPKAPTSPSKGIPVWVWIVAGVVALIVVGGLVFWLVWRKRKPAAEREADKPRKAKAKSKGKSKSGGAKSAPRSTPGRRPALLRDISNATGKTEHEIIADTVQIGRATAQSDDIQSIVVKMNTVGRRHAVIEYRHHTYWLVDQGSLNGTFLNGERIHRERALNNGAHIQLESAEFEFAAPEAQTPGVTAAADPGEFVETLVASEEQAKAMAEAAVAAKAKQDIHAAETVIEMKAPEDDAKSTDDADNGTPGSGTVDFDVFGSDADPKSGQ